MVVQRRNTTTQQKKNSSMTAMTVKGYEKGNEEQKEVVEKE